MHSDGSSCTCGVVQAGTTGAGGAGGAVDTGDGIDMPERRGDTPI